MSGLETLVSLQEDKKQTLQELHLHTEAEYFEALKTDIGDMRRGDRSAILTMSFEPTEKPVNELTKEITNAANRGAEIVFGVDAYSFLIGGGKNAGPMLLPLPFGQNNYRRRLEALEELGKNPSISYAIINKPKRLLKNPYAGRSHLKTAVVNDKIYVAGLNLHQSDRSDMAVSLKHPDAADWLYDLSKQIVEAQSTSAVLGERDHSYQVDKATKILIDSGVRGQSVILDEALKLIAETEEEVVTSFQYFPDKRMLRQLADAHKRGVKVTPFHNHPSAYNAVRGNRERLARAMAHPIIPKQFLTSQLPKNSPIIHSKAMASEKAAIVGSHNFVDLGVNFGTAEIALLRQDPDFAKAVGNFLLKQVSVIPPEALAGDQPPAFGLTSSETA